MTQMKRIKNDQHFLSAFIRSITLDPLDPLDPRLKYLPDLLIQPVSFPSAFKNTFLEQKPSCRFSSTPSRINA